MTTATNQTIHIGATVRARGLVMARFVVLGFREIEGETYAQVKERGPDGTPGRGELVFPVAKLVLA